MTSVKLTCAVEIVLEAVALEPVEADDEDEQREQDRMRMRELRPAAQRRPPPQRHVLGISRFTMRVRPPADVSGHWLVPLSISRCAAYPVSCAAFKRNGAAAVLAIPKRAG